MSCCALFWLSNPGEENYVLEQVSQQLRFPPSISIVEFRFASHLLHFSSMPPPQLQTRFDTCHYLANRALLASYSSFSFRTSFLGLGIVQEKDSIYVSCMMDHGLMSFWSLSLLQFPFFLSSLLLKVPFRDYSLFVRFPPKQIDHSDVTHILYTNSERYFINPPLRNVLLVPGSFNPLHEGHLLLARSALKRFPSVQSCVFELSIRNADKSGSSYSDRIPQFFSSSSLVVMSKASLFLDKARLFPGSVFVLGADTVIRLIDPKYYHNQVVEMLCCIEVIVSECQCRLLVAGRVSTTGIFTTCEDEVRSALPPHLFQAFEFLSEAEFRLDISSTQLRLENNNNN